VCKEIDPFFTELENVIQNDFFPKLLDSSEVTPDIIRSLFALPTKAGGVGIPIPTSTCMKNFSASKKGSEVLMQSLSDRLPLCLASHKQHILTSKMKFKNDYFTDCIKTLNDLLPQLNNLQTRKSLRAKETGSWLSAIPTFVNGLSLSKGEFRDGLRLRYGLKIDDLPKVCDGCNAKFTVNHALSCKKRRISSQPTQ